MITLSIFIAIFFIVVFGALAIIFSAKQEKTLSLLKQKEKAEIFLLLENAILKKLQENTDSSIDCMKFVNVIKEAMASYWQYSAFSSMIIGDGKIRFNFSTKEAVGADYAEKVKNITLNSLGSLTNEAIPEVVEENIEGQTTGDKTNSSPLSFFNIPLVLNGKLSGLINLSSVKYNFYQGADMAQIYKIIGNAAEAATRLQSVILKEDGRLADIMSGLEGGAFMIGDDNRLVMINPAARDILNLQKENTTLTDVLSSLPSSYNFADKIVKAISLGQKIEEKNIRLHDKNIDAVIVPVFNSSSDKQAKAAGAIFFIHDATPEKSLAKMKEDFTNIIVHELRSPLTSIKASSEMLNGQNSLNEEERKKLISIIYDQSLKMLNEVSMILDAAKLDSGLFTVHKTPGDLKKIITESAESFRTTAQNKFINLAINVDPFMPQVSFDAPEIRRVIVNLLTNSLKFTPGGGTITVRAWTTPDKIYVSVIDTGTGIPQDKQHMLFSKFAQVQSANATIGTGLGLYISKGIIDAHNGTISVHTEPGRGTTITFSIPNNSQAQPVHTVPQTQGKPLSPMAN